MRNVTIVVPVLITSCQVLENPNTGPSIAHATTQVAAIRNAQGLPIRSATRMAVRANQSRIASCLSLKSRRGPRFANTPSGDTA